MMSENGVPMPRAKMAAAILPKLTPVSPFSIEASVLHEIPARSATRDMGSLRLRRAVLKSSPNFLRERETWMFVIINQKYLACYAMIAGKIFSVMCAVKEVLRSLFSHGPEAVGHYQKCCAHVGENSHPHGGVAGEGQCKEQCLDA